jgi:hypothetical protein
LDSQVGDAHRDRMGHRGELMVGLGLHDGAGAATSPFIVIPKGMRSARLDQAQMTEETNT